MDAYLINARSPLKWRAKSVPTSVSRGPLHWGHEISVSPVLWTVCGFVAMV